MREFVHDLRRWGFATAAWNLRFNIGWTIGGFTHARRDDEGPDGRIVETPNR